MRLLGNFLVVLTLVLSLLFASLSIVVFATHKNWRDEAKRLKDEVTKLESANKRFREEIEQAKTTLAQEQLARKMAIASLETQLVAARDQYAQAQAEATRLAAEVGTLVEKGKNDSAVMAAVTAEVTQLRSQLVNDRADRDQQFANVVKLTDDLHSLQGVRDNLLNRNTQLAEQNARMKKVLEANDLSEFADVASVPPKLDGIVMAVGTDNLVEISLGSDDGLKVGHTLDVYRGTTYLGRIEVVRTLPSRSVAKILPEYRKGQIRTQDRVATRFVN
ncbi:MAG: hypothetical protein KatS3mg110_0296 [Pirellulaceae bacterium]|nr:MAG: hypothetical protein KatS3mg110_0296 [Pirellulaceae bacterium]